MYNYSAEHVHAYINIDINKTVREEELEVYKSAQRSTY